MSKQDTQPIKQLKANIWDYTAALFGAIALLFLILNVNNRVLIIDRLSQKFVGSIGMDAPIHIPLVIGLAAAAVSLYTTKGKGSKVWLVAITILMTVLLVWCFGLGYALKHSLQP